MYNQEINSLLGYQMGKLEISTEKRDFSLECYPDQCPRCHLSIDPIKVYQNIELEDKLELVFRCPSQKCKRLFISVYQRVDSRGNYYRYAASYPKTPPKTIAADELKAISPTFYEIYDQAMIADNYSLTQLVGIGLRKSLEFLIKDYCIKNYPEDEKQIKKNKQLSQIINKYLEHPTLREIAEKTVWLGNDETHYQRQWETKDINDLKKLHQITQHYFLMEIEAKKYIEEMTSGENIIGK